MLPALQELVDDSYIKCPQEGGLQNPIILTEQPQPIPKA